MRRFLVIVVAFLGVLAFSLSFDDVITASSSMKSVRCHIKAWSYRNGRESYAEFQFYFVREEKKMRIEYLAPKNMMGSYIAMDGKYFYTYILAMNRKVKRPLKDTSGKNPGKDLGVLYDYVLGDLQKVVNSYDIKLIGEEKLGYRKTFVFELSGKKRKQMVWVDEKALFPVKVEIYEKGKLVSRLMVENFELNVHFDDSLFSPF